MEHILGMARREQADLIVMGPHGRTGLARVVLGSVAEHVVRQGTCPVMTVKAPVPPGSSPQYRRDRQDVYRAD